MRETRKVYVLYRYNIVLILFYMVFISNASFFLSNDLRLLFYAVAW